MGMQRVQRAITLIAFFKHCALCTHCMPVILTFCIYMYVKINIQCKIFYSYQVHYKPLLDSTDHTINIVHSIHMKKRFGSSTTKPHHCILETENTESACFKCRVVGLNQLMINRQSGEGHDVYSHPLISILWYESSSFI